MQADFNELILEELKKQTFLLEKIANREGLLGNENLEKVRTYICDKGSARKAEIMQILNVSPQAALAIMKRLAVETEFAFIPGKGRRSSRVIYAKGDSDESKALVIFSKMRDAPEISIDSVAELFGINRQKAVRICRVVESLFEGDVRLWGGKLVKG